MKNRKFKNYWTKERCQQESLKYKNRSSFKKKSPGAFSSAYKNNWLDDICKHMKVVGNRYIRSVYVYTFKDKFAYIGLTHDVDERNEKHRRDKRSKVYQHIQLTGLNPKLFHSEYISVDKAVKLERDTIKKYKSLGFKILNVAKAGSIGGGNLVWTLEKCKKEAKRFKTRREFAKKSNSAYNSARRYGWLDIVCAHMNTAKTKPAGFWTKEKCLEEVVKYNSRNEFYKKSPGAYSAAFRNGWLNEICPNMKSKKPNGYWTKERCLEEALKYKTKKSFRTNNNSVYSLIIRNGWINEIKNLK